MGRAGTVTEDERPGERAPGPAGAAVRLVGVVKDFGEVRAVDNVSLEIRDGEFFSLLGPSGSGKTTLLRLVAGFEQPTAGRVELAGHDVTGLPPNRRDVHTVFQDYALFPHMTVEQNVAYALTVRGVPRAERRERAHVALRTVRLDGHGPRRPAQLSGGQRQRVALARALIDRPPVLLLDEPLGALDLKLRQEMQVELKELQRQVGITFVLVTHDQDEALTMSDRIAVVDGGRVQQTGTPAEVYQRPATAFVAGFVGSTNLLSGEAAERLLGRAGTFSIRPERIRLAAGPEDVRPGERSAPGTLADVAYAGAHTRLTVLLDGGGRLTAVRQNADDAGEDVRAGTEVLLAWREEHAYPVPGPHHP